MLTYDVAAEWFDYNPADGLLVWRKPKRGVTVGREAGAYSSTGYKIVRFDGRFYYVHRLAWLLSYREWPKNIDHINRDKLDNRLENLRSVTQRDNCQNREYGGGKYGQGVRKSKDRFYALIKVDGKIIRLGSHKTPEEAQAAYLEGRKIHHPFFAEENVSSGI